MSFRANSEKSLSNRNKKEIGWQKDELDISLPADSLSNERF